jgi:hypothetical protein
MDGFVANALTEVLENYGVADQDRIVEGHPQMSKKVACRLALGGTKERPDARPGGADPFGQVALGDQFEFDLPPAVERVEDVGVGLPRERADHLGDPTAG